MNITVRLLRENKIFNSYGLAKQFGEVFIDYTNDTSRGGRGMFWAVYRVGYKTNSDGPWYEYGYKTFYAYGRQEKEKALNEAKEWASNRYGITEWDRDAFGSWHPKEVIEKLKVWLKQQQTVKI